MKEEATDILRGRKGQFEVSFGMIFSVIVIIAVIVVAFYIIMQFLEFKDCTALGLYYDNLESEINKAWASTGVTSKTFSGDVPSAVDYVCFGNLNKPASGEDRKRQTELAERLDTNMHAYFYPSQSRCGEGIASHSFIRGSTDTVEINTFFCVPNIDGKASVKLTKSNFDASVKLSRV